MWDPGSDVDLVMGSLHRPESNVFQRSVNKEAANNKEAYVPGSQRRIEQAGQGVWEGGLEGWRQEGGSPCRSR
jgi:hypothetical protein